MAEYEHETAEMRTVIAALRLAQDDPQAAVAALAPVLDGSAPVTGFRVWLTQAFLLEAIARDALGDPATAGPALERALDVAEPEGTLLAFLLHPAPRLLERHTRHPTAHAVLIAEIRNLLAGGPGGNEGIPGGRPPRETVRPALSNSEARVLRFLPSNLSAPEIAGQLYLSVNTVRTHMQHLYGKLGAHRRGEAVQRARALGLLTASSHGP
jgi:LuxR family maltose regulon positive regulatory protein